MTPPPPSTAQASLVAKVRFDKLVAERNAILKATAERAKTATAAQAGDDALNRYRTLRVVSLRYIHLIVVVKAELLPRITHLTSSTCATGIGGVYGNKGGAGIGFEISGGTSLAFVTSHLAARPERVKQRNRDYVDIVAGLGLRSEVSQAPKDADFLNLYDHVFWSGDFNYRIDRYVKDDTGSVWLSWCGVRCGGTIVVWCTCAR